VKDGVRCELVKMHTINKEKPTKKLVGRKRKAVLTRTSKSLCVVNDQPVGNPKRKV
jgi:hypothetical protein